MSEEAKEMTLEEAFAGVEHVIGQLEDTEVSLEDSFKAYQKGMELLKLCADKIDKVEKQMLMISESGEYREF